MHGMKQSRAGSGAGIPILFGPMWQSATEPGRFNSGVNLNGKAAHAVASGGVPSHLPDVDHGLLF